VSFVYKHSPVLSGIAPGFKGVIALQIEESGFSEVEVLSFRGCK